jgi:hypothetical protein
MSVSVLDRPYGHVLGDCVSATIDEQYGGYATVNKVAHGLIDGDYVYIQSNVESYNGFWYVDAYGADYFKIRRYASGTDQAYIVDASITYCPVTVTHGWSCVHLPITYRLKSDIFPTNSVDTSRTVSSFGNDNGYVNLNLSGSLDSGPYPEPFESIIISGTNDLDGVYQIVEVVSATSITINLVYDSTYSFSGGSVIRYYSNYNIVVRVYGGLNAAHAWAPYKPYELLATLNFIPDENGEVFFSVNEILKKHINLRNNTTLDYFPNNLDYFTQFYITYAERYDDSLGSNYMLSTYTSSYTTDSFEGVAVNAKLPFKNTHSGALSDYYQGAQWLTLFDEIQYNSGTYQDLSVLITDNDNDYYLDISGTQTALSAYDLGVYRIPLTQQGVYSIYKGVTKVSNDLTVSESTDCERQTIYLTWLNYLGGMEPAFAFTADKEYTIDIEETGQFKGNIFPQWGKSYGQFADSISKQTFRQSRKGLVIRSQYITQAQLEAIQYIKTSPLVQIINSRTDKRTVIVDEDSFTVRKDNQDLFDISFSVTYTDEIPSQVI